MDGTQPNSIKNGNRNQRHEPVAKTFIDLYLDYTRPMEAPTSFFKWSAYATIGAILRDNVFVQLDVDKRVYSNMFVILIAGSGERKSIPVGLATSIVTAIANTKTVVGRSSIEAVIDELGSAETSAATGKLLKGGSCILLAEELLSFFVSSDSLVPLLTDMYDFKSEWDSRLRGTGKMKIKNLCLSMLAASNETHLKQIYSTLAVHGGLLGRTFLVKPDERRPPNSLFKCTEDLLKVDPDRLKLKHLLDLVKPFMNLQGPCRVDRETADLYDKWYHKLYSQYGTKADPCGVLKRLHTSVIKLSAVLGVNRTMDKVIQKRDVEEAIEECTKLLPAYQAFIMSSGNSSIQQAGIIVLTDLWAAQDHKLSRRDLLTAHWGEFDYEVLDKVATHFEQAGMLKAYMNGPNVDYVLTPKAIEILGQQEAKKHEA